MVMDMFVPVSPSGTGKTFSSFRACLWISIEAAALMIILRKSAPFMVCLKMLHLRNYPIIMESIYTFTARTWVPVHFVTT